MTATVFIARTVMLTRAFWRIFSSSLGTYISAAGRSGRGERIGERTAWTRRYS